MAARLPKEDLELPAPPTAYCVRYEGNGSKRWDGKSILIDAETLLMSYTREELVVGKEVVLPWKSKTKGTEYWKAKIIDNSEKESKTQEKEAKIQEEFKTTEEHREQEDTKKRRKRKKDGKKASKAKGNILEVTAEEKVKDNSAENDGVSKILATLVDQQGQVLSKLSTLITQTRPAITTTQPTENPKPFSDQLTDNFF